MYKVLKNNIFILFMRDIFAVDSIVCGGLSIK
jgi:hypothetical protein